MIGKRDLKVDGRIDVFDLLRNGFDGIPRSAGIYYFWHKHVQNFAYIGTTSNLRERVKTHLGKSHRHKNGNKVLQNQIKKHPESFYVGYAIIYDGRETFEKALIKGYQPMYNRRERHSQSSVHENEI